MTTSAIGRCEACGCEEVHPAAHCFERQRDQWEMATDAERAAHEKVEALCRILEVTNQLQAQNAERGNKELDAQLRRSWLDTMAARSDRDKAEAEAGRLESVHWCPSWMGPEHGCAEAEGCAQEKAELKAEVERLRTTCEAVLAALKEIDLGGQVLWIPPPYQAEGVHETVHERLKAALEAKERSR